MKGKGNQGQWKFKVEKIKLSVNFFFFSALDNFLEMQKFTFKVIILLLVMCAFVWLCECMLCVCEYLQRPSEGNRSPETGVIGSDEPHNGVLVMESDSSRRGCLCEGCIIGRLLNLVDLGIQLLHAFIQLLHTFLVMVSLSGRPLIPKKQNYKYLNPRWLFRK